MERCTAKAKRSGLQCQNAAVRGFPVCRFHGAGSKPSPGGRPIVHGRYSKHLPERLAGRYNEAISDAKLLELRDVIALVGTRLSELVERLDRGESTQRWKDAQAAHQELQAAIAAKDSVAFQVALKVLDDALRAGVGDSAIWREIAEMTEQRRKLVESEHKRLVAMQQMITSEQAMILLAVITDTVRKHVSDPAALAAISAEFRAITLIDTG